MDVVSIGAKYTTSQWKVVTISPNIFTEREVAAVARSQRNSSSDLWLPHANIEEVLINGVATTWDKATLAVTGRCLLLPPTISAIQNDDVAQLTQKQRNAAKYSAF
jgi:hypothetical protein